MQKEKVDYLPLAKQIAIVAQSSVRPAFDFLVVFGSLDFGRRNLIGHGRSAQATTSK